MSTATRTWTDSEIADRCEHYQRTGSTEFFHVVELVCAETGVGPERVRLASARRLYGRV